MKKWTMTAIRKMSREELIKRIDAIEKLTTVFTGASKQELINKFVGYVNKGMA